jgi:2-keto-4-pentenoate hydratase/2-oxohepta-3-ene-1,7-dioic acid hydratase in catechol pathway
MTRLARRVDGTALIGDGDGFVPLRAAYPDLGSVRDALPRACAGRVGFDPGTATRTPTAGTRFGTPLERFGKLWGIGLNYAGHAADLDENPPSGPASFMKPSTALTGPGGPIRLPAASDHVTAEAELGLVIGRTCRGVSEADAADVVAGYVPVIDVTAEDILRRNPRFLTRAKGFDSFLVVGPWLRVADGAEDLSTVEVRTVVDGTVEAANTVGNMQFPPRELVAAHSRVMTLEPGDLISTGTPGAARITAGDTVRAEVDGVGTLAADVVRDSGKTG